MNGGVWVVVGRRLRPSRVRRMGLYLSRLREEKSTTRHVCRAGLMMAHGAGEQRGRRMYQSSIFIPGRVLYYTIDTCRIYHVGSQPHSCRRASQSAALPAAPLVVAVAPHASPARSGRAARRATCSRDGQLHLTPSENSRDGVA